MTLTLTGLVLGVVNIAIVIAVLLLIGALIVWFCGIMGIAVPYDVRRMFFVLVALIALYMLVALLLGMPSFHLIPAPAPAV
jgi:hypothetical protein